MVWGEARGCSTTEQASVVWCALNRPENLLALVGDVMVRWMAEMVCVGDVGRGLTAEHLYFTGDGRVNTFRDQYQDGNTWDWSLDSPYEE